MRIMITHIREKSLIIKENTSNCMFLLHWYNIILVCITELEFIDKKMNHKRHA